MKKFISMVCVLVLYMAILIPTPAMAANPKPAVELMHMELDMNSVGGVSVELDYRNNSGKTIKYIDWHAVAYNRVNDRVACEITGNSSVTLRVTGPVEPERAFSIDPNETVHKRSKAEGTPFSEYRYTSYKINDDDDDDKINGWSFVFLDKYGNLYAEKSYDINGYVYLTDEEINNAIYDGENAYFENVFYNHMIDYIQIDYAVVTYMDNTKQTVNNVTSEYYNHSYQNEPFLPTVARYSDVYNCTDYKEYNPDLVTILGDNEKLLFEHFTNNGMNEGRQENKEFNLSAYKSNNPDLVAAFGDDNAKYYEHYISTGKAEGRKAA